MISFVSSAINNSFLYILTNYHDPLNTVKKLFYVDRTGKKLMDEIFLEQHIEEIRMISDREVILHSKAKKILQIIDLTSGEISNEI